MEREEIRRYHRIDMPQYEHVSNANALRYANFVQECESAQHAAIRLNPILGFRERGTRRNP